MNDSAFGCAVQSISNERNCVSIFLECETIKKTTKIAIHVTGNLTS